MSKIIAQAFPHGVTSAPISTAQIEITSDLEKEHERIGSCIANCAVTAQKRGFDPAIPPFVVLVTFM